MNEARGGEAVRSRLRAPWLVAIVALGAAVCGCGAESKPVSLAVPDHGYAPDDYPVVLRTWTRSRRLNTWDEMDNVLTVTSTYFSPEFRAAYLAKYRSDFHLDPSEYRAMSDKYAELGKEHHEFYVALFAQRHEYGKLNDAERTAWQVDLIDDQGHVYSPARVEFVRKPGALERSYFPYTSEFRQVFRVIFDKNGSDPARLSPHAKWFGLRFSGPQGTAVLKWYLS